MRTSSAEPRTHLTQVVLSLECGGSETLARDIALSLDPVRFQTSICALDAGGPLERDLREAGRPVHVVGRRPGVDWALPARLYRFFRRQKVDIVQTHHLAPLIYSALPARLAGAYLVHVEHERFSYGNVKARRRLRLLAALCHRIVVVGGDIKDYLVRSAMIPASKVSVIGNGVDVKRYAAPPRLSRRECGLPEEGRLIGHVGRLAAAKDQATLLSAFKGVGAVYPDARLVVVGDGPLRSDLEELARALGIESRVTFLGLRFDVPDLLPHFELFVLSSVNEGLPLAILEAMAAARPVLSTAVGEIPAVIDHRVTGLLVSPGDAKLLADGLTTLLERPEWAAELGRGARSVVEARFSVQRSVVKFRTLYGELGGRTAAYDR